MATQLTLLIYTRSLLHRYDIPAIIQVIAAFGAIAIILCMPLRDPALSKLEICLPFEPPTHQLRSPEDCLTLWQFMTVSWMSPLISLGAARQLNDEDIWSLAFEFQHHILHDRFRELKGSVVTRLLAANGLDLVITTFLGIVESLASMDLMCGHVSSSSSSPDIGFSTPVLLQRLLQTMEDINSRRSDAVTYALLSLLVRLVACQSSVFSLWFSRRCYERSRGEMITMLYEKTLARKIVGAPKQFDAVRLPGTDGVAEADGSKSRSQAFSRRFYTAMKRTLNLKTKNPESQTLKEIKEPASTGKILNLMRHVALKHFLRRKLTLLVEMMSMRSLKGSSSFCFYLCFNSPSSIVTLLQVFWISQ